MSNRNDDWEVNNSSRAMSRGGDTQKWHRGQREFSNEPVEVSPLEVKVVNNFDAAFKAFRALVQKEKVVSQYKERQGYEKPSEKKRRKSAEARRKLFELEVRRQKMISGELDREKLKKQLLREKRQQERALRAREFEYSDLI